MQSTRVQDLEKGHTVDEGEVTRLNKYIAAANAHQGTTLLPRPIASLVSTGTGIASLSVRATTKVGGWTLYGFREGTLKSLSVSRSVIEQVLVLAGRDVAARSNGEWGRQEAAGVLEWSVSKTIFPSSIELTIHVGICLAHGNLDGLLYRFHRVSSQRSSPQLDLRGFSPVLVHAKYCLRVNRVLKSRGLCHYTPHE